MQVLLHNAGFEAILVEVKEESREAPSPTVHCISVRDAAIYLRPGQVISQWMPGSGAEDFVVSANISATKPLVTTNGVLGHPPAA